MPVSNLAPPPATQPPVPHQAVRRTVEGLLTQSPAFSAMSDADRAEIARNTALVADYIARPEGIPANQLQPQARALLGEEVDHSGTEATWEQKQQAVDDIGKKKFSADAAREGATIAGELLKAVSFPQFVSELINGVFKSITTSSIEQMDAYQKMIASVATSLGQFMDDHVDENQGRDNMVDQFPDLFEIQIDDFEDNPRPRLGVREGVDEAAALKKINSKLEFENGALKSLDLSDENVEKALVENSRMQLARQRQQLMASIVLMGINRIVVTDGKISAKIIYDVKATDRGMKRRSATAMDVARNKDGSVQTTYQGEGEYDSGSKSNSTYSSDKDSSDSDYSADYFAKGKYKYENKPIITMQTAASESNEAVLQTKIQLSGIVDVNFKSDYLPLDKMATPGMIAAIQGNSTPVDPNVVPSARSAPTAAVVAPPPVATPAT